MTETYQTQLNYVFQRPVTEPAWFWQAGAEADEPFNGEDPLTVFDFMAQLVHTPATGLAGYSDDQIGQGLQFIFSGDCSGLSHAFKSAPVSFEQREEVLRKLWHLFRDVLVPRCPPVLAARSQEKLLPLPYICYMFWDVCPLSGQWPGVGKTERRAYYEAVAWVMQQCLTVPNPAVVESGLHGLGHMVIDYPAVATPILDAYLARYKNRQDALAQYARAARTGGIQ